jgi:simple sugar transport system substrate-binding protein/basic membrane protein A
VLVVLVMVAISVGACAPATPAPTPVPPTNTPAPTPVPPTNTPAPTPAPATPAGAAPVRLAILMTGEITDLSWNAQMYRAAMEIKEKLGIDVAYSEQIAPADGERVMREYADEGYNLIIAHSFSYGDAVFRVAQDYPNVNFAWAGGMNKTAQNVADYDQPFYQASYLIGILAGGVSKGTMNFLGGFDIPVCHSMAEAFKAGARSVNPNSTLLASYVGDWGDVAKAKEAALAQIDAGADFGIGCGEGPTLGMIEAAKERGVYATGYVGDMSEIAPDTVLTSLVWNLYPLLETMVKDVQAGTFQPGKFYSLGVAQGAFEMPINPKLKDKVPASVLEQVEKAKADIIAGKLEVPYIPQ